MYEAVWVAGDLRTIHHLRTERLRPAPLERRSLTLLINDRSFECPAFRRPLIIIRLQPNTQTSNVCRPNKLASASALTSEPKQSDGSVDRASP
ncbi:hypothetical protein EYF80_015056 [Liparis tanakae]|uniref:Uncharacterized protein n=1 Tax=Liparis tanakae TaxID=230148 RepID=A0A4Z2I9U2_9TELE|nr:hypothetical protein EYF80_015056 [Liparis tanakae]